MFLSFDLSDILFIKDHWRRQQSEHKSTEGVPVYSINPTACREIVVSSSLYKSLLSLQKKSAEQLKGFVIMIYV